jgi:N-methylhydantoinase B
MTNSFKAPVEVLEITYPVRGGHYAPRRDSGGRVRYRGGDINVRRIKLLAYAQLSLLSDRHTIAPYGLNGGPSRAKGKSELVVRGRRKKLLSKCCLYPLAGLVIRSEAPGGGGWGAE